MRVLRSVLGRALVVLLTAAIAAATMVQEWFGEQSMTAIAVGVFVAVAGLALPGLHRTHEARATRRRERRERADAAIDQAAGQGRSLPRVRELAGDQLFSGLHRAIPLADPVEGLSDGLPAYVPRDIDLPLRAAMTRLRASGGFIVVVGDAATGKTRCLLEALLTTVNDRRILFRPDPQDLPVLVDEPSLRRAAVWLDDAERYLTSSGLTPHTLRGLMRQQVVVVGALWPQTYERLSARYTAPLAGDRLTEPATAADEAGEVLDMAEVFLLSDQLSNTEREHAEQIASVDPRIREALSHEYFTQSLAARPNLEQRWYQPGDPLGAALLEAAVGARLAGHPEPLPRNLIEQLAVQHYVTPRERAMLTPDWFRHAETWATRPVRGTVAPLYRHGTRPGVTDGYEVSDVLVQLAGQQHSADTERIAALIEQATPDACLEIGVVQVNAGRPQLAEAAWLRCATDGMASGMYNLGLLAERTTPDRARGWYQRAADKDHLGAVTSLGLLAEIRGDDTEAVRQYTLAGKRGDKRAMFNLGLLSERTGDPDRARHWYEQAADLDDVDCMINLGSLLKRRDRDAAIGWTRRAAETGSVMAMSNVGQLLTDREDYDEARLWLDRAVAAGNSAAIFGMATLLEKLGDTAGAKDWFKRAADNGSIPALNNLGMRYQAEGERDLALTWLRRGAEAGDVKSMVNLAEILLPDGETTEALTLLGRASDAGDPRSKALIAQVALHVGQADIALAEFHSALAADDISTLLGVGPVLYAAGHRDVMRNAFRSTITDTARFQTGFFLGWALHQLGDYDTLMGWFRSVELEQHLIAAASLASLLSSLGYTGPLREVFDRSVAAQDFDRAIVLGAALIHTDLEYLDTARKTASETASTGCFATLDKLAGAAGGMPVRRAGIPAGVAQTDQRAVRPAAGIAQRQRFTPGPATTRPAAVAGTVRPAPRPGRSIKAG